MDNDILYDRCPYCKNTSLCNAEDEICCTSCGAVLGHNYLPEQAQSESKLNLYQATEIGTKKVNLECARHMHESNPDKSALSNACVKLGLPIHVAHDANTIYRKIIRKRQKEKIEYAIRLKELADMVKRDKAGCEELEALKRCRPRGCTKAHTAAFALHSVCMMYGLPRTDEQILESVRMNFGVKRRFTMLKAYSLNGVTEHEFVIKPKCDKATTYVRLQLSKMQDKLGTGALYDKVMRHAIMNLEHIHEKREDARAAKAVELALGGIRLAVQI